MWCWPRSFLLRPDGYGSSKSSPRQSDWQVAESFTGLYADTHDKPRRITIKRLDGIFNRLVFYRNLCAHDERCYCARYDGRANENVYQAIGDLGYLLDKDDYLELFRRFLHIAPIGRRPPCAIAEFNPVRGGRANGNWPTGWKPYRVRS